MQFKLIRVSHIYLNRRYCNCENKVSALWVCVLHLQSEAELVEYHHTYIRNASYKPREDVKSEASQTAESLGLRWFICSLVS